MLLKSGKRIDYEKDHNRRSLIRSASIMIIDNKDSSLNELLAKRRKVAQELLRQPGAVHLNDSFDQYQEELKKLLCL